MSGPFVLVAGDVIPEKLTEGILVCVMTERF